MPDKDLIAKNFEKSINTYDKNAIIQKQTALELVNLIKKNIHRKNFNNILEIGSYSGILTKEIVKNFDFNSYLALDIINSFGFIKDLSPKITFKKVDVENFSTDKKFDLIVSNASLQWTHNFVSTVEKLKNCLSKDGVVAITTFGKKNLYEIKECFNVGLNYPSVSELKKIFSKNATIIEKTQTLNFKTAKSALLHLKLTGVNSVSKNRLSIVELKEKMKVLNDRFNNSLTYNPIFIID